jgi:hypothetical protein
MDPFLSSAAGPSVNNGRSSSGVVANAQASTSYLTPHPHPPPPPAHAHTAPAMLGLSALANARLGEGRSAADGAGLRDRTMPTAGGGGSSGWTSSGQAGNSSSSTPRRPLGPGGLSVTASGKRKARDYGDRCVKLSRAARSGRPWASRRPFHGREPSRLTLDPSLEPIQRLAASFRRGTVRTYTLLTRCSAQATARRVARSDRRDGNEARASSSTVKGVRAGPPSFGTVPSLRR